MIIAGLTGNYGMGKSTAASMLRKLGAVTIDTDEIVQQLLHDPIVTYEIKKVFGDDIIQDNSVNRKKLADIIFQHPHFRISLENILHPLTFKKIDEMIDKIRNSSAPAPIIIIVEIPVIFERGYQNRFDRIITVFTSEEIAIKRLKENGITEYDARRRMKSQFAIEMKIDKSDFVIDNTKDIENTIRQVEDIYQELLAIERIHGNN